MPKLFVNVPAICIRARLRTGSPLSSTAGGGRLSPALTMASPYDLKETSIKRSLAVLVALVAVIAVAVPALAASGEVNVPAKFSALIPKVKKKSGLAVRLPSSIHVFVKPSKTFADGSATKKSYFLELDAAKSCHGSNACFL